MTELNNESTPLESTSILERLAQTIIIGYAWVAGPGMTERQRVQQEVAKAHTIELELESTSIVS